VHQQFNIPQLLQQTRRNELVALLLKPDVKLTAGLVTKWSVSTVGDGTTWEWYLFDSDKSA